MKTKARNYMAVAFLALLTSCADLVPDLLNLGQTQLVIRILDRMSKEELSAHRLGKESLLSRAVRLHDVQLVRYLLARGVSPDNGDTDGETPLISAAYSGYTEIGQILIDAGANLEATEGQLMSTPLLEAARKCRLDFVEMLIQRGANQQARNVNGHDYQTLLTYCKPRSRH